MQPRKHEDMKKKKKCLFSGQRWEYALGHMMQHTANHSSYHRGQVVTLFRQLGKTPEATDFLVFLDETAR